MEEFVLSPDGVGNVTALPEEFGGGAVSVTSYSGSVTVRSTATAEPGVERIEILGGMVSAPAVTLPTGQSTGPNTFTFTGPGESEGFLDRTSGEFRVSAVGELTNDALGPGQRLRTVGDYFGTANLETGELRIDSTTLDFVEGSILDIPGLGTIGVVVLTLVLASVGILALRR